MSRTAVRPRRLVLEPLEIRLPLAAFIKFAGIQGESMARGFEKEIDVLSCSWGVMQAPPGGKAQIQDFHFVIQDDKASPKLQEALTNGKHFQKVRIEFVKEASSAKKQEYIRFEMKEAFISSYQLGMADGMPVESFALSFDKIKIMYQEKMEKGTGSPQSPRTYVIDTKDADARGPDLNGDGTADPLFFNYATLVDFNNDGLYALIAIGDANRDGKPDNMLPADLNGDGQSDPVQPRGALALATDTNGDGEVDRNIPVDHDGDGNIDPLFTIDGNGDGLADWLAEVRIPPIPRGRG